YLVDNDGCYGALAAYAVAVSFVLRAFGRFLGVWLVARVEWTVVLLTCSGAMAVLFWAAMACRPWVRVFALTAAGLFMSVLYPTLDSTGISCFDKGRHGAVAGLLLFFTCVSAVLAPLAMGALGDALGDSTYAILLGAVFATLLVVQCAWNAVRRPFTERLAQRNEADYAASDAVVATLPVTA